MTRCVVGSGLQAYSPELRWQDSLAYWQPFKPTAQLIVINNMNDKKRVFEAQSVLKDSLILARYVITVKDSTGRDIELDGALHTKPEGAGDTNYYLVSPENYLNLLEPMAEQEVNGRRPVLYWMNEPSGEVDSITFDRLVKHTVEGIALGNERKRSLCVLNWSVGHPLLVKNDTELDPRLDHVLMAIANSATPMYWGLHLYEPADTIKRLEALEGSCKRLGIEMPLTIITEWGFDAGYAGDPLNGYKTRGKTGYQLARFTIEAVNGKLKRFFQSGKLVAVIGFCEGGEPKQHAFNYENDQGYKDEIKRAVLAGELDMSQITTTSTPKSEIVFGKKYTLRKDGDVIKAYLYPYNGDPNQTYRTIPSNAVVTILDSVSMSGDIWYKVTYPNLTGAYYIQSRHVDSIKATVEVAAVVLPDTKPLPEPPVIETPPVKPDVSPNGKPPEKPAETPQFSHLQRKTIDMLLMWQGQLQFEINEHQANIDMCTERLTFINQVLEANKPVQAKETRNA